MVKIDHNLKKLEQCSEYTFDPFWKDIFINCSKNKFPKSIFYDKASSCIKANKEIISLTDSTPIGDLFLKLCNLFKKLGVYSASDDIEREQDITDRKLDYQPNFDGRWQEIGSSQLKSLFLMEYIHSFEDCSRDEKVKLYAYLNLLFKFKVLMSDDIIYEDRRISKINKLEYSPELKQFTNKLTLSKHTKSQVVVEDKFIKGLKKYAKTL